MKYVKHEPGETMGTGDKAENCETMEMIIYCTQLC